MLCKHQVIGSIPIGSTILHIPRDEDTSSAVTNSGYEVLTHLIFDIVNGFFKIDAVKVSALKVERRRQRLSDTNRLAIHNIWLSI